MNLWSLDGINPQVGLADDQKIEVVIDNFTYTPSGETHVADGGACSKHCHCSPNSTCDAGTCQPVMTTTATTTTATTTTTTTTTTAATAASSSATCSAHPDCAARRLAGDCCPTSTGVFLYCCSDASPTTPEAPPQNQARACAAHQHCTSLAGDCCPTLSGAFLYCCDNYAP